MSFGNSQSYDAYTEGGILSSDPVHLIVMLYEGAIQSLGDASACLKMGDFAGRATHVAKVVKIINELLLSLRDEQAGEVSKNLRGLYSYMQSRLLCQSAQRDLASLEEVRSLLSTLLEAWRTVSEQKSKMLEALGGEAHSEGFSYQDVGAYSSYLAADDSCRLVASF